jgi:hypothetical protein
MARAVRTFNTDCNCGTDHDTIEWLVASTLFSYARGLVEFDSEMDIGLAVAQMAEQCGWVRAGDEVEDLRVLLDGVTGLDEVGEVDFEENQREAKTALITNETVTERVGLAMQGDHLLFVQWDEQAQMGDDPARVVGVIYLTDEGKRALIQTIEASIED